jgi:hypothetical protein
MGSLDISKPQLVFLSGVVLNWVALFLLAYGVTSLSISAAVLILGTACMFGAGLTSKPHS